MKLQIKKIQSYFKNVELITEILQISSIKVILHNIFPNIVQLKSWRDYWDHDCEQGILPD